MIDVSSIIPPEARVLRRWLAYAEDYMAPDSYWVYSLLACVAAAINGRVRVNPGGEPNVLPNLFVVLIGPSGSRKGTPIRHSVELLAQAVPQTPLFPEDFTSESLLTLMAKESDEKGYTRGFIINEEFVTLIAGKEYRLDNAVFLLKLWDGRPSNTRYTLRYELQEVKNPYIGILSAMQATAAERLDARILSEGFLRRVLFVVEQGSKLEYSHPRYQVEVQMAIAAVIRQRLGPTAFGGCNMMLSPKASAMNEEWCSSYLQPLAERATEREGHFANCAEAHAMKLAACVALLEGWEERLPGGGMMLHEEALRLGQQLVEALVPPMFEWYAGLSSTGLARLRTAIFRVLRGSGGRKEIGELYRNVAISAGVEGKEVQKVLLDMVENKQVVVVGSEVKVTAP